MTYKFNKELFEATRYVTSQEMAKNPHNHSKEDLQKRADYHEYMWAGHISKLNNDLSLSKDKYKGHKKLAAKHDKLAKTLQNHVFDKD